jgi:hypothetical protein
MYIYPSSTCLGVIYSVFSVKFRFPFAPASCVSCSPYTRQISIKIN